MNDCLNAEMRDLLPDLLHDRLAADVRAAVTAHVSACIDCREELEVLRHLPAGARAPFDVLSGGARAVATAPSGARCTHAGRRCRVRRRCAAEAAGARDARG